MKDTKKALYDNVVGHLAHVAQADKVIKGFVLLGGSLAAGVAQFMDIGSSGIKSNQIIGIAGCVAVFAAALWATIKDKNASEELRIAIEAQHAADEARAEMANFSELTGDVERASNLIVATNLMRGLLEHLCSGSEVSFEDLVDRIFLLAKRQLALSMGLTGNNEWTICVYQAEVVVGRRAKLPLIGHARAIECSKSTARVWEEGVGVAGICYSNSDEIIVPDLQSDGVGTLFNVGQRQRDYDSSRYQSIVAVPIMVDHMERPWGVVTATSDRRNHFVPDAEGIQHAEGARVLANMLALAVAFKARLDNAANVP